MTTWGLRETSKILKLRLQKKKQTQSWVLHNQLQNLNLASGLLIKVELWTNKALNSPSSKCVIEISCISYTTLAFSASWNARKDFPAPNTFHVPAQSVSLKVYAHDDTSVGSWMMGLQATYIDDNRLCCSTNRQGKFKFLHDHNLI